MKIKIPNLLFLWVVFLVIITSFCGLVYVTGVQFLRQSADDPQIEMSEDVGYLSDTFYYRDNPPKTEGHVFMGPQIDIAQELTPFRMVFDEKGQLVRTDILLEKFIKDYGHEPTVPRGVFDYTKQHRQDHFTWAPVPGVRIAAVMTYFNRDPSPSGFLLVGRSLREDERREERLQADVVVVWVGTVLAISVLTLLYAKIKR